MGSKIPTISLCMIVKNEEKLLPQCLTSATGVFDEIIVVDTGSTDSTVEIAEQFGAKVYFHEWESDFAKARNISLSYATCDWIFILDADEALEREDIEMIKKSVQLNKYNVIYCAVLSDSPNGWGRHYSYRIFRRDKAHYEGIVHNQLIYEGKELFTAIRIYHYGYNLSKEEMEVKFKRTEELLLQQIHEDSTDIFAHVNYLRVLRAQKRYEEGIAHGKKAFPLCRGTMLKTHEQMIGLDMVFCMLMHKQYKEGENSCSELLKKYPANLDLLFLLGNLLMSQKKYQEAIQAFQEFLSVKENETKEARYDLLVVETLHMAHKVWANLSDCFFHSDDYQQAVIAAEKSIELKPDCTAYKIILARSLCAMGKVEAARKILDNEKNSGNEDEILFMKWFDLCEKYPELGNGFELIKEGIEKYPESENLHNCLAYAVLNEDQQMAKDEWLRVLEINPDHLGAYLGLVELSAKNRSLKDLEDYSDAVLKRTNQIVVYKDLGLAFLSAGVYKRAIDLLESYIIVKPEDGLVLSDIATCYANLGQYVSAFRGYKEALRLCPQNSKIIGNLKKLQHLISLQQ